MCTDTEEILKIWRGIDFSFQSWHEEFDNIWPEHWKVSKTCDLMGSFWPTHLMFELKMYRGVIFHDTSVMENFNEKWLVLQKIKRGIYKIFTRVLESLKIGTLMGSFYPKYKMYKLKIYMRDMCHCNEEWCKIWRIDISVQNWHEKFDKFWPEHSKIFKKCTLTGCFRAKYKMSELKKVQRSYVWWHWILMENLMGNWLLLLKIWQIITRTFESLEIGTLMGSFHPK